MSQDSSHRCPVSVAREIHDRVMQRLCGVAGALASGAPLEEDDRKRCSSELETAINDLRAVILGEPAEPSSTPSCSVVDAVTEACLEAADLRIEIVAESDAQLRPPSVALVRDFAAEAIRNAFKHGSPARVTVCVRAVAGRVLVDVQNDGVKEGEQTAGTRLGLRLLAMDGARLGHGIESGSNGAGMWLTTLSLRRSPRWGRFERDSVRFEEHA